MTIAIQLPLRRCARQPRDPQTIVQYIDAVEDEEHVVVTKLSPSRRRVAVRIATTHYM